MSKKKQQKFFDGNAPVVHQNSTRSCFRGLQAQMYQFVNKSIVDVIVVNLLFYPEDSNDKVTKERALDICEYVVAAKEAEEDLDMTKDWHYIALRTKCI